MAKCGIGIIGCGKQGERHAVALSAGGAGLVCADFDREAASALAGRCGGRTAPVEGILADPDIGGVVIATPTPSHFDLISASLRAGKHVLSEKPLARSLAEAEALARLEAEHGRHVSVGFVYRYVPAFERLAELARQRALGPLVHAVLRIGGRGDHRAWKHRRAEGGGALHEMAVHMLDLGLWLFGPLRRPVVVAAAQLLPRRTIAGHTVAADADDYLVVRCETEGGAPVLVLADMVTPGFTQYLDVQYENASAMASIVSSIPSRVFLKEPRAGMAAGELSLGVGGGDLYRRQADAFIEVVTTGRAAGRSGIPESIAVAGLVDAISAQVSDMSLLRREG